MFINTASCSFSSLLNCTSPCGASSRNRQDLQYKSCGLLELDPHGEVQFNKDEKLQVIINKHSTFWVGDWVSVKRPLGVGVSSFFSIFFFAINLEIDSFLVEKKSLSVYMNENPFQQIVKTWNCACDLNFLRLAHFPVKIRSCGQS